MNRSVYARTACTCSMPGLVKLLEREAFEKAAEQQGLQKGRRKPQLTRVAKYVAAKHPKLAKKVKKVLRAQAKRIAAAAKKLYAKHLEDTTEKLHKDVGPKRDILAGIIADLNALELGEEVTGELTTAMRAAFRRAAAVGITQVGIDVTDDITKQVDKAAVRYAEEHGGELITDLAGTTDDDVQRLLARAVDEGMSADELSDAVLDLGAFGDARADTIARTELAFAHIAGNKEGWTLSGEVVGKRVILGDQHDVPDICDDAADAGVVPLEADFVDGASDPPFHPNCVCDIEPILREEDDG